MTFDTIRFCVFFMMVMGGFYLTPVAKRKYVVLASSVAFYLLLDVKVSLLGFVTVVFTYFGARIMERLRQEKIIYGRCCFWGIITILIGILLGFKYLNFASDVLCQVLQWFHLSTQKKVFELFAMIGLSYYTLKAVMYVAEVYQERRKPEKDFVALASYLLFFPQIIAGPIDPPRSLLSQLKGKLCYREELAKKSLLFLASGYMKKLVIANMIVGYVDCIYDDVTAYGGLTLLYGIFLYSVQIYCDFSGYSEISIGLAGLLGIEVGDNFHCPYLAADIKDFWNRWHISLSGFLKEYIYIPLGGNRKGSVKKVRNILVTFVISGLWHGANYTFLFWGFLHGILNCLCKKTKRQDTNCNTFQDRVKLFGNIALTFVLVTVGWVFFRANSFQQAVTLLYRLVTEFSASVSMDGVREMVMVYTGDMMSLSPFLMSGCLMFLLFVREYRCTYGGLAGQYDKMGNQENMVWFSLCIFFIICFGNFGSQGFIYANF